MFLTNRVLRLTKAPGANRGGVLVSLLRLRQQYQQSPTSSSSSSDGHRNRNTNSTAMKAPLELSAKRLLEKQLRPEDALSDVDPQSTQYAVEVGKLLAVSTVFDASTQTPRVSEALEWVTQHRDLLRSVRQVMSLCMPLLNLKDGKSNGKAFVMNTLYEPLLKAVQENVNIEAQAPNKVFDNRGRTESPAVLRKQNLLNLVSVLQLVTKLLDAEGVEESEPPKEEKKSLKEFRSLLILHYVTCETLHTVFTEALKDSTSSTAYFSAHEVYSILQSFTEVEKDPAWLLCPKKKEQQWRNKMNESYAKLSPILRASLQQGGESFHRLMDLVGILQCLPLLSNEELKKEITPQVLALIPSTSAHCQGRDLCSLCMTLIKMDSTAYAGNPSLLKSALPTIVVSVRQRVFSLTDTQEASRCNLFPHESSALVSALSRLQEQHPSLDIPLDVCQRLCATFIHPSQVNFIQPGHILPFVQGLARFQEGFKRGIQTNKRERDLFQLRLEVPEVANALEVCFSRLQKGFDETDPSERTLTQLECAQALFSFAVLGFPNTEELFASMEKTLQMEEAYNSLSTHEKCAVMKALLGFVQFSKMFEKDSASKRAREILQRLIRLTVTGSLATPKDCVEFLTVWRSSQTVEAQESSVEGISTEEEESPSTLTTEVDELTENLSIVLEKIHQVHTSCNLYECGTLASILSTFMDSVEEGKQEEIRTCVKTLVDRASALTGEVELSQKGSPLNDVRKLIDSARVLHLQADVLPLLKALNHSMEGYSQRQKKNNSLLKVNTSVIKSLSKYLEWQSTPEVRTAVCEAATSLTEASASYLENSAVNGRVVEEAVVICYVGTQLLSTAEEMGGGEESVEPEAEDEDGNEVTVSEKGDVSLEEYRETLFNLLEVTGDLILEYLEGESGQPLLSAKLVMMLLQSFEMSSYNHTRLLSHLLPNLKDVATTLKPLEVSLLLHTLAKIGLLNSRVVSEAVVAEASRKIEFSSLRECHSMLRGMQRSGYLRRDFCFPNESLPSTEWYNTSPTTGTQADPFAILLEQVTRRLSDLLQEDSSSFALEDLVSTTRCLAFFQHPPRPLFDTYCALAVKELALCVRRRIQKTQKEAITETSPGVVARLAVQLLECIGSLQDYSRQATCSAVLSSSLKSLMKVKEDPPMALLSSIPLPELVKFASLSQIHYLLYDQNMSECMIHAVFPALETQRQSVMNHRGLLQQIHGATVTVLPSHDNRYKEALLHLAGEFGEGIPAVNPSDVRSTVPFIAATSFLCRVLLCCSSVTDNPSDTMLSVQSCLVGRLSSAPSLTVFLDGLLSPTLSQLFLVVCVAECFTDEALYSDDEWNGLIQAVRTSFERDRWRLDGCVNVLLGASAQYDLIVEMNTSPENHDTDEEVILDGDIRHCASLAVTALSHLLTSQSTLPPTQLLSEMFRLLTSNDGSFARWCFSPVPLSDVPQEDAVCLDKQLLGALYSALLVLICFHGGGEISVRLGRSALSTVVKCVRKGISEGKTLEDEEANKVLEALEALESMEARTPLTEQ